MTIEFAGGRAFDVDSVDVPAAGDLISGPHRRVARVIRQSIIDSKQGTKTEP